MISPSGPTTLLVSGLWRYRRKKFKTVGKDSLAVVSCRDLCQAVTSAVAGTVLVPLHPFIGSSRLIHGYRAGRRMFQVMSSVRGVVI